MSDGDALLRGILANPACDTARLVYADFLEENGEGARAEFVRVQVELAGMKETNYPEWLKSNQHERHKWRAFSKTHTAYHKKLRLLCDRERQILDDPHPVGNYRIYSNKLGWTEDVRQFAKCEFTRGFVSHIEITCADLLKHAKAIFSAHPVMSVRLMHSEPMKLTPNGYGWLRDLQPELTAMNWARGPHISHLIWELIATESRSNDWKWFSTEADAHAALSEACVAHGRARAELPALVTA